MTMDVQEMHAEILDRQAIRDCLATYCRGVDRLDRAALESVYHPDAVDDHGAYVGPASGFIDWALDFHATYQEATQHSITNHLCDIDGNVAHCETYWTYNALNKPGMGPRHGWACGRYIDRFEKRDGRWAIVERVCVIDINTGDSDEEKAWTASFQPVARNRSDPAYQRPLQVPRERFTV